MHWIDWLVMTLPLIICAAIAIYTRRYVRSVADFMAGGRGAGRFLICAARSEQGSGAAVFVASFQAFMVSGFITSWWGQLSVPVGLLIMVTGFVIYRYRQTRAMTLGQFFEMRYSRKFRLFAGILGLMAGLINFGIIPAVGAHFMVAFLGWPQTVSLLGLNVPTYLLLMGLFLTLCVVMTTTAGQVSVLLTDCAEGMFSQLFYTIIGIVLLVMVFKWSITKPILLNTEPGKSLVNPFDAYKHTDFNLTYVLIGIFGGTYRCIAWQNSHAFNSSAANPHEARMGSILGRWRGFAVWTMVTLLSVCAMTFFKTHYAEIQEKLSYISDPSIRSQMESPTALTMMLPTGIKGMLLSICLMGIIAGDGIHLHSWGSIFIQDVLMPFRKKPFTPQQHILLLRLSIVGVAAWAFLFGWMVPQIKYVQYWWGITEAIFVSGAGVAIIGGLYWSRGTKLGAWAALITGSTLAFSGLMVQMYHERVLNHPWIVRIPIVDYEFNLNVPWICFLVALTAISCYTVFSLLGGKQRHNMDRLLHRGAYAVEPESEVDAAAKGLAASEEPEAIKFVPGELTAKRPNWLYRLVTFGIDEQFSRSDRWITIGITLWSMAWFAVVAIGTLVYFIHPWSNEVWATYWLWASVYLPLVIGTVTTVWFTIGCWHDMRVFFRRLREERVDVHDDGTVSDEDQAEFVASDRR